MKSASAGLMKSENREGFAVSFSTKVVVRYAETDQMGIAHHSNYAVWYELARTEFTKTLGMTYTQMEAMGVLTPLVELSCRYLSPARYEDELTVEVRLVKLTRAKLEFTYAIYKEGNDKPLNTGKTVHAMVDASMKPVNVEKKHPELYAKLASELEKED